MWVQRLTLEQQPKGGYDESNLQQRLKQDLKGNKYTVCMTFERVIFLFPILKFIPFG